MQNNMYIFFIYLCMQISRSSAVKCGRGHIATENDHYEDAVESKRGNWPWMVKLTHKDNYLCGGSIFHAEFILTSAHCLEYHHEDISNVDAVVGAHTLLDTAEHTITVKIKKILDHPFYSNTTFKNDIAIVQLAEKVDFQTNKTIQPVCLPVSRPKINEVVHVIGWGKTRPFEKADHEKPHRNHSLSNILQQAKVIVLADRDFCQYDKGMEYYPTGFCTSFAESGHHECIGDSGSPVLFQEHKGGSWFQEGIVSWSEEDCGGHHHPAVNTVVLDYVDWIAQVINFTTGIEMNADPYPSF